MATSVTNTTFPVTYKDDFVDSDNYHRILFNSGKALQARELTQMQTIIQEEISRFGSNIFVEGGVVNGSGFTVDNNYEFIKLAVGQLPSATGSELINQEFIEDGTGVKFKILEVVTSATTGVADTLYVKYTDTSGGTSGANPVRVANNAVLTKSGFSSMTAAAADATGAGTRVSVAAGSFFVQGHFVFAKAQTIIASYYSATPNLVIGFKIDEEVITTSDDTALFDNQGAVPNTAAPGADRYRIKLTLIDQANITSGQNFVYLFKLFNGRITDEARKDNSYATINDVMALRTKEESGNYIVKDFTANFEVDSANTGPNIILKVSDGIAYVDGYRIASGPKDITVQKARDTVTINNEIIRASYGNYIDVYGGTDNAGLPDIHNFQKLQLTNDSDYAGAKIGTARVRALYEEGTDTLRAYLFDIKMNSGQSFSNVKSIGYDSADFMNFVLDNNQAILKNTSENDLLFPLPKTRPSAIDFSSSSIQVQRRITFSTGGGVTSFSGQGVLPEGGAGPGAGYSYTSPSQWILSDSGGNVLNISPDSSTNTTFSYNSGLTQNTNYELLAQVSKTPAARAKTLTETTHVHTANWPAEAESDGSGILSFSLNYADIFEVTRIRQTDSNGADLSDNFTLDNGQRDNFYGIGRLVLKPGRTITGKVFARYKYFEPQAGDFFDVSSYSGITYDKIPNHTLADGTTINLRDYVDFRPVATKGPGDGSNLVGSYMTFDSNGAGAEPFVNFLPENGSTFRGNVTYYQPRIDRLVASTKTDGGEKIRRGEIKVVKGTPDLNPQPPVIPDGSMPLYNLKLNAYTLNDSDTEETIIPAKGFTMADIATLEKRIDNLAELTTLSLLELDTSSLTVLDSAGLTRTKAGFLVDNFKTTDFSAIDRDEYRAVADVSEGILNPITIGKSTSLYIDSGYTSVGNEYVIKGDTVMMEIDSNPVEINQILATEFENINPFAVIVSRGRTILSPETDEWVETRWLPNRIQNQGSLGTISRARAQNLARRDFSAAGFRDTWFGRTSGATVAIRGRTGSISRVVANRVVDISVIPFMRSRLVFFKSEGLRPNTQHFLSFGGQDMANYVRSETTFKRVNGRTAGRTRTYTNATVHPNGASTLVSDSAGELIGSFLIPSTNNLRFRTGIQEFLLLDVTGGPTNRAQSLSTSEASFQSSGELQTRQRSINITTFRIEPPSPPPDNDGGGFDGSGGGPGNENDPLAQSFFVDPVDNPNGYFITQVDAFFRTKDDEGVPVECQIRGVEQGFPNATPLPGASVFLPPASVNIPGDLNDMATIQSTPTTFTFEEPVYVQPGRSYAVVLKAESTKYNVYVAKTYDFVIGSTEARINKQPTLGSLFMSQSGITWTADQTRDMMFRLKRAQFQTASSSVKFRTAFPPDLELISNPILTDSGSSVIRILQEGHGLNAGNSVTISGLDSATAFGGLRGLSINGTHTVTRVDHTGFTFDLGGSAAIASLQTGGDGIIMTNNMQYDQYVPRLNAFLPDGTSLTGAEMVHQASNSFGDIRNVSGSTGNTGGATSAIKVALNEFNFTEVPYAVYGPGNLAEGQTTLTLNLENGGDNKVSPVINLQRTSIVGFETVIDTQDSADFSTVNVPLARIAETSATGGTSAAKHITTPVVLEEPAKGLKILFAGNRPSESKFKVYFKTASGDEALDDAVYTEVSEFTDNPSDEDKTIFRQYEYLPGGIGGTLSDFTKFQVKIEMIGTNAAKAPSLKDLRILALVT